MSLYEFVTESNRIEGINRTPTAEELSAHREFLDCPEIRVAEVACFVRDVAGVPLRDRPGMNVMVGSHLPPKGGPGVRFDLEFLLENHGEYSPYEFHVAYEKLHPFMDGNGRSGRAIWALADAARPPRPLRHPLPTPLLLPSIGGFSCLIS